MYNSVAKHIIKEKTVSKINHTLIDEPVKNCKTKEDIFGPNSVVQQLIQGALQNALNAELEVHLEESNQIATGRKNRNTRNGYSSKTVKSNNGDLEINTPRDRDSSFEPQIIKKHQRRVDGFDDLILTLYAKGMTTRDIQDTLKEMYQVDISHNLISRVTESVQEDIIAWQNRALDNTYVIVYFDCLVVKIKKSNQIINQSIYLALGVNMTGRKELLGMWVSENEGSKFGLNVMTEMQNRVLKDILIACIDGLKGFPDAIQAVYPNTQIQLCIVHQLCHSFKYVPYKDKKAVSEDLKAIYTANTLAQAEEALSDFEAKWDDKYPAISKSWRQNWHNLSTLFKYPKDIRKVIYTTNAIESLNMVIRKAIRNRRIFPCESSAFKVIFLAVQQASKKWNMPIRNWSAALNRFEIEFEGRC